MNYASYELGSDEAHHVTFAETRAERDAHISELTGIPCEDIPEEFARGEKKEQVLLAQAGDDPAMQRLIVDRLRWVYDDFAQRPEVQKRYDLELEDILQIGSLAAIEAVNDIDPDAKQLGTHLGTATARIMVEHLDGTRLAGPTGSNKFKATEAAIPSGHVRGRGMYHEDTRPEEIPEAHVLKMELEDIFEVLGKMGVTRAEQFILNELYNPSRQDTPRSYVAVGAQIGLSAERVRQRDNKARTILLRKSVDSLLKEMYVNGNEPTYGLREQHLADHASVIPKGTIRIPSYPEDSGTSKKSSGKSTKYAKTSRSSVKKTTKKARKPTERAAPPTTQETNEQYVREHPLLTTPSKKEREDEVRRVQQHPLLNESRSKPTKNDRKFSNSFRRAARAIVDEVKSLV